MHANLRADQVTLTEADLAELARVATDPEEYWRQRAALSWH